MTLEQYQKELEEHHWLCGADPCPTSYYKGVMNEARLVRIALQHGEAYKLAYNAKESSVFEGKLDKFKPHFAL